MNLLELPEQRAEEVRAGKETLLDRCPSCNLLYPGLAKNYLGKQIGLVFGTPCQDCRVIGENFLAFCIKNDVRIIFEETELLEGDTDELGY